MSKTSPQEFLFSSGVLIGVYLYFGIRYQLWDGVIILSAISFSIIGFYKSCKTGGRSK